jgi:hypothetical protein
MGVTFRYSRNLSSFDLNASDSWTGQVLSVHVLNVQLRHIPIKLAKTAKTPLETELLIIYLNTNLDIVYSITTHTHLSML